MAHESIIEHQHHELVSLFTRLNDAVVNKESRKVIYQITDDVIAFTRLHFSTEEQLMILSGYPEIEWHKEQHNQLLKDALNFREKFDYIDEELFSEWFNHWPFARMLAHIQYADKQAADYIQQTRTKSPDVTTNG
jgi:hemerythrin